MLYSWLKKSLNLKWYACGDYANNAGSSFNFIFLSTNKQKYCNDAAWWSICNCFDCTNYIKQARSQWVHCTKRTNKIISISATYYFVNHSWKKKTKKVSSWFVFAVHKKCLYRMAGRWSHKTRIRFYSYVTRKENYNQLIRKRAHLISSGSFPD